MTPDALRALIAFARSHPRMVADNAVDLRGLLYERVQRVSGADIGAAWCAAYPTPSPSALSDAEACDVALRAVDALWPQGDAPAGDECAAFSDVPLDAPMPPAFVEALAGLSVPALPGALDLAAIEARVRSLVTTCWHDITVPGGGCSRVATHECQRECCNNPLCEEHATAHDSPSHPVVKRPDDAVADARALVARVRELEVEVADLDALVQRQGALLLATANALKGPPPPLSQHSAHDMPEVAAALVARLAAAQPVLMLDAIRNGRFGAPLPDLSAAHAAWAAEPDTDLCPKCGALDLDHVCPKSAATVAGEAFAAEHPYAAGAIMGGVAKMEVDDGR